VVFVVLTLLGCMLVGISFILTLVDNPARCRGILKYFIFIKNHMLILIQLKVIKIKMRTLLHSLAD
jgi:hypothetical protein